MSSESAFTGTSRFEVRREVGSGGFGTVYQVWDREHSQLVALKHLHRSDPLALRRFKQEFRSLANLAHLHLVSLYELHQSDAHWFFTMEFVEGATFADWLRPSHTLPPEVRGASIVMTRPARPNARPLLSPAPPLSEPHGASTLADKNGVDHAMASAPTSSPSLVLANMKSPALATALSDTTPSDLYTALNGHPGRTPVSSALTARPTVESGHAYADPRPSSHGRASQPPPGTHPSRRSRSGSVPLDLAQPFFGIEIPDKATMELWEATRPLKGYGAPDPERARVAFRQLVEALAWLHSSGHLHRDVKPSNVLVSEQGIVKVLDFGLVTRLFLSDPQAADSLVGTPAYMAPELCAGLAASPASDWYSVGVMLYLVLTGHLPFAGDLSSVVLAKQALDIRPPSELNPVPKDLEDLCMALLARNPVERPDASALLGALGDKRRQAGRWTRTPSTGFVGRRREVTALAALLSGRDGGHDIALVEGLSGLGKSSLVEHVLRSVEEHGDSLVLRSRCFERGSVRFRALDGAVDDLAQWLASMPSYEADRILPGSPADRQALGRLFPALPGIAREGEAVAAALNADPGELKRRAFGALRQLVAAAARHKISTRPDPDSRAPGITIYIDDAQWADEDSLMPLAELFRGVPAGMVRWVLSYRSDERETSPFLAALFGNILPQVQGRILRIELGPLAPEEAIALAVERLASASPEQARAIALEAEGSPLFITELSRLIEGSRLAAMALGDDRAHDDPTHRRAGLSDLLAARVLDLPVNARAALELIAVAGEPVPARLIRSATGADQRDMNRLVQDHLVAARASAAGEMVMTWHDRVRETVAWRLSRVDRARRHRTLAEVASAQGGADDLFLHTHWREAGVPDKAREHGIKAAEAAMRAFAFDRAAEIYRSIIALESPAGDASPLASYHEALGDALRNAGRGVESAKAYLAAAARIGDLAQVRRLEILAAEQFMFAGAFGEGEAVIRAVLGRVGLSVAQSVPGALASFAWESMRMRLRGLEFVARDQAEVPTEQLALIDTLWSVTIGLSMAQPLASQAFQQRHLRAALEAGEPLRVARALTIESAFSGLAGGNDERRSQSLSRRTHEVARTIPHPYPEAFATMSDGANHWLRGRWPEARKSMETAVAVFERDCTGVSWEKDTSRFVALTALAHEGDFTQLARRYEAALYDALERGDLYMEVQLRTRFGPLLDMLDDRPQAARIGMYRALGRWTAAAYQVVHYWSFLNRVSSFLYEGDGKAAWREVLAGSPPLKRSFMLMGQYYSVQYQALVAKAAILALQTATPSEAHGLRKRVHGAAAKLAKHDMGWSRPKAKLFEALLAVPDGIGPDSRAAKLSEAAAGFTAVSMYGHSLAAQALLAETTGDRALAATVDEAFRAQGALAPERFRRIYSGI